MSLRAAEQDRPDVAKARVEWRENQPKLEAGRLFDVDFLKMDGPFPAIAGATVDLVRWICMLCREIGCKVIGEMIEDDAAGAAELGGRLRQADAGLAESHPVDAPKRHHGDVAIDADLRGAGRRTAQ